MEKVPRLTPTPEECDSHSVGKLSNSEAHQKLIWTISPVKTPREQRVLVEVTGFFDKTKPLASVT